MEPVTLLPGQDQPGADGNAGLVHLADGSRPLITEVHHRQAHARPQFRQRVDDGRIAKHFPQLIRFQLTAKSQLLQCHPLSAGHCSREIVSAETIG